MNRQKLNGILFSTYLFFAEVERPQGFSLQEFGRVSGWLNCQRSEVFWVRKYKGILFWGMYFGISVVMNESSQKKPDIATWKGIVAKYQEPSLWRALWQMINTFGSYALLWWLMYLSLAISWWLVVPLAVIAGGFVVRIFIIFHDCGHGSYFKSHRANDIVGFISGVLTFTPYYHWRWEHNVHHATSGHLDKRGTGDVWTMTVQEYLESSRWKRFTYRLARNPFILFVIAPLYCSW